MCKYLILRKKKKKLFFLSENVPFWIQWSRTILIMSAFFLNVLLKMKFQPNLLNFTKCFNFNWTVFSKGYHIFSVSVSFWASELDFGIAQCEPLSLFPSAQLNILYYLILRVKRKERSQKRICYWWDKNNGILSVSMKAMWHDKF